MIVAFVGNPCPQIYILTNLYTIICLTFMKIILIIRPMKLCPHEPRNFLAIPMNIDPHE